MNFYSIDDFWKQNEIDSYSIIHLGDVIEHLDKPANFLKHITEKLKQTGGILLIEGPLENNKNFAFFVRYLSSWLISKIRPGKEASHVPYHITFSNARNQLQLFETAGFSTIEFKVFETFWPYPAKPGKSVGSWVKYLTAALSLGISRMVPFLHLGNRFIYAGTVHQAK